MSCLLKNLHPGARIYMSAQSVAGAQDNRNTDGEQVWTWGFDLDNVKKAMCTLYERAGRTSSSEYVKWHMEKGDITDPTEEEEPFFGNDVEEDL